MTFHSVTPTLAVATTWKRGGLCPWTQGGCGQRSSFCTKTNRPLWTERSSWLLYKKNPKLIHWSLCMTGLRVRLCIVTEIDWPMRFRAGVFTGFKTPVRLLDFATGLTLLLLGSWSELKKTNKLKMFLRSAQNSPQAVVHSFKPNCAREDFKTTEHTSGICNTRTPHLWFLQVGCHFTLILSLLVLKHVKKLKINSRYTRVQESGKTKMVRGEMLHGADLSFPVCLSKRKKVDSVPL